MPDRETADSIDDAAADWAARLDRGLSEAEQHALEAWLALDSRRVGALARARALWCHAEHAMLGMVAPAPAVPPVAAPIIEEAPPRMTRRWMIGGSIAAAAAGVLVVQGVGRRGELLESGIGEVRRIALEDGSAVTLGPGTQIRRQFDTARRLIEILSGDAFFEVVQDAHRPFVVTAGFLTLRAVGTAFSVRAIAGLPLSVIVAHGQVAVSGAANRILSANTRLDASSTTRVREARLEPDALQRALAWREGMLSFEGDTLASVARQFDRFGPVRIEIADASLAREPITGLFAANDPRGFARAIATSLDARVEAEGDVVRLRRGGSQK